MSLLVIIVTYNAMHWIKRCICSVKRSTIKSTIYVIDNGSTDGTQNFIKSNYKDIIFYQSKINLGFGKANNIGLQYAINKEYDYIYLLNQDAWVTPNTFELLIDAFNNNEEYGILSPLQCEANLKKLDQSFFKCIVSANNAYLLNNILLGIDINKAYEVEMVMAAHWMISRKCLLEVGGFSPTFPHYGEDVNYKDRLHFWKMKMGIVPAAIGIHDRENRKNDINKLMYQYYMIELCYLSNPNKHRKPWLISWLMNYLMFLIKYKKIQYIKYLAPILINIKDILINKKLSKKKCAFININK